MTPKDEMAIHESWMINRVESVLRKEEENPTGFSVNKGTMQFCDIWGCVRLAREALEKRGLVKEALDEIEMFRCQHERRIGPKYNYVSSGVLRNEIAGLRAKYCPEEPQPQKEQAGDV